MATGFRGTFVISWSQTEVDGIAPDRVEQIAVGATWRWQGSPVRVDGPSELLRLENTNGYGIDRKSAARMVRRLVGAAIAGTRYLPSVDGDDHMPDSSFVVTNGRETYTVTVILVGSGAPPLLMFVGAIPPRDTEMWVVHHTLEGAHAAATGPASGGVICFTPGTRIKTPDGARLVEDLREGDRIQTKDNGAEEIQWIGSRHMTGARLFAMPKLRPVRIRAGALGSDCPDAQLLVSPEHRMLVKGDVARALFNTPEVLVSAKDLINSGSINVDLTLREVTYIHLLLPRHQIVWANGLETESFHPASTAPSTLAASDRRRLLARFPALEHEPHSYGSFARRGLSAPEAAILAHQAA
ncbi:Hint domain-containing protein [Roseovarius dicentrarchi]|uniref:Hint domain-containing protein n=1 Tax=Roseovarius dicentrarchi TaxID=2250573 RepID=UPI000DE8FA40|nr:Hint domain-containing protein [Roseovarius dicentrarchi]